MTKNTGKNYQVKRAIYKDSQNNGKIDVEIRRRLRKIDLYKTKLLEKQW